MTERKESELRSLLGDGIELKVAWMRYERIPDEYICDYLLLSRSDLQEIDLTIMRKLHDKNKIQLIIELYERHAA